ncbi:MFS transporter [Aneurinibacillus sp. Ricciae_BoGa-3]|uniref:MFS transporter n=1 Tax=Aneurinibacillus sp. Ricciae_BoGa-3 TaxID=3022697 RepID=UPI00233FEA75|nr:MFS transporter [Aneurinibacillus sp. Ricciae_BoGa-3]WCK55617.1 MFS transporter [Aneurinibacillus sp. Ricciae_BoGa-3]
MRRRGQTAALVLSTIAMTASFIVWTVFTPLAAKIQLIYHLNNMEKSILIAIPVLLGSLMRIPIGILADRYGGRKVYTYLLLFLLIPILASSVAHSFVQLVCCALFIGMAGTSFAVSVTYVSKWFPSEKQGTVLGIVGMGNIGSAIANFFIPLAANKWGIIPVFYSLAILILLIAATFWLGTQEGTKQEGKKSFNETLSVLKYKETWYLSLFYFLTFGGFVTFSVYLPILLQELFHISIIDAGFAAAGFVILATLLRPVGGYLSDRYGSRRVLAGVFSSLALCGLLIAVTTPYFAYFIGGCFVLSIIVGIGNGAVFKMVSVVSSGNTGAVTGIVGAVGGVGGFIYPIVLRLMKDTMDSYSPGFLLLAALGLLCFIINRIAFAGFTLKEKEVQPTSGVLSRAQN